MWETITYPNDDWMPYLRGISRVHIGVVWKLAARNDYMRCVSDIPLRKHDWIHVSTTNAPTSTGRRVLDQRSDAHVPDSL